MRRRLTRVLVSLPLLVLLLASCAVLNPNYVLPNICKEYDNTPVTQLAAPDPNDPTYPVTVFEVAGQFKVMHGYGAAKIDSGKRIIKVQQGVPVPNYANQAAVFLNGWKLTYLSGDHHAVAIGAAISKIHIDPRRLRLDWEAAGVIRDNDFNDGYEFKYYYTVIAWASAALDLRLDQGRPDTLCNPDTDLPDKSFAAFNTATTTALSSFSVFSQDPGNSSNNPVAVLPRGFAFVWYDHDHHLYQLGYNLGHSEIFAEEGKIYSNNKNHVHTAGDLMYGIPAPLPSPASRVDSGFVSWNTSAIIKDDSSRRDYIFGEMISTLSGSEIGLVQPAFSILPWPGQTSGLIPGGGVITKDVVIENVPFEFAVPMLTGWNLAYVSEDQHVKEVGAWIDEWSYTPSPTGGTLRYKVSTILRDKDYVPGHDSRHKVTILGIRPIAGQPFVPHQSP